MPSPERLGSGDGAQPGVKGLAGADHPEAGDARRPEGDATCVQSTAPSRTIAARAKGLPRPATGVASPWLGSPRGGRRWDTWHALSPPSVCCVAVQSPGKGAGPVKRNLQAGVRRNAALRLEVFTDADLDDIHRATLEVLERTGVFVESDEALDVMADGGCRVESRDQDREDPAPHRRRRHPLVAEQRAALRARAGERRRARGRPRRLHQLQRRHHGHRPAHRRVPRVDHAGRRRSGAS